MTIIFPSNPAVGDDFLAENGSTYIWTGAFWSSALAVITGRAEPVFDGGDANPYNSALDNTLEGGVEHIIGAN
jgi:hypothetical protein